MIFRWLYSIKGLNFLWSIRASLPFSYHAVLLINTFGRVCSMLARKLWLLLVMKNCLHAVGSSKKVPIIFIQLKLWDDSKAFVTHHESWYRQCKGFIFPSVLYIHLYVTLLLMVYWRNLSQAHTIRVTFKTWNIVPKDILEACKISCLFHFPLVNSVLVNRPTSSFFVNQTVL